MKCTNCQHKLKRDANFCPQCGTPVSRESPPIEANDGDTTTAPSSPETALEEMPKAFHDIDIDKEAIANNQEDFVPAPAPPIPSTPGEDSPYVSLLPHEEEDKEPEDSALEAEDNSLKAAKKPFEDTAENAIFSKEKEEHFHSPPIPPSPQEQESKGRITPPSQHTMDAIDLAVAHDMDKAPTVFEDPPLYIPQPKRNPISIIITVVIVLALVGGFVLFATGRISLPSFTSQSPMVLSSGTSNIAYGMPRDTIEDELGVAEKEEGNLATYSDGILVRYRNSQAVRMELSKGTSSRWHTSGNISIGDSRSDIFKAYGTDHLVSVLKDMGRISDSAEISTQNEYLIPYQIVDGNLVQINTVNQQNYEANPLSYFWVALRLDENGLVDTIIVGDSIGVFETS